MPTHFGLEPFKSDHEISYSRIADFFLLCSNSITGPMLYSLRKKERTPSEISKIVRIAQKVILPELMALQSMGILVSSSKSQRTFYRLADDRILKALELLHKISQRKAKNKTSELIAKPY
jgi:DNA-binding transcriptional ArsR family regulator